MKQILFIAVAAVALASCDNDRVVDRAVVVDPDDNVVQNVDECPRADGTPCR